MGVKKGSDSDMALELGRLEEGLETMTPDASAANH